MSMYRPIWAVPYWSVVVELLISVVVIFWIMVVVITFFSCAYREQNIDEKNCNNDLRETWVHHRPDIAACIRRMFTYNRSRTKITQFETRLTVVTDRELCTPGAVVEGISMMYCNFCTIYIGMRSAKKSWEHIVIDCWHERHKLICDLFSSCRDGMRLAEGV